MARNEEKAQSMLNRFRDSKRDEALGAGRRPGLASECDFLPAAEKWRMELVRDIQKKISGIQSSSIGEHKIRDMNDEINKLLRIKHAWEVRILELGGPNYKATAPIYDADGTPVLGHGYKYFGAAKDLPGVRDLFEKEAPQAPKRLRADMFKMIDADYYGYRDEDDGRLLPAEEEAERAAREEGIKRFEELEKERERAGKKRRQAGGSDTALVSGQGDSFRAHVPLPSTEELEKMVVEKRKEELMKKYVSPQLLDEAEQSQSLLKR